MNFVLGLVIPFLYLCLVGGAYAMWARKSLAESLAPTFFVQILIILVSGMVFGSVGLGIIIGVILAIASYVYCFVRDKSFKTVFDRIPSLSLDMLLVTFVYLFIYVINYGKHYHSADEFTHWGVFLRETYRLDALYVTSPLGIIHKDYVPAVTLFEALWCKLSFKLSEANAYRGIQILQVSMLLPVITKNNCQDKINKKVTYLIKTFTVLSVPVFITGLLFYHTIYQDYIYGVLVFFCMWLIVTGDNSKTFLFEVTLAITILLLTKMTAMAFLPMIVFFYCVYSFYLENGLSKASIRKTLIYGAVMTLVPLAIWKVYTLFSIRNIGVSGGGQSYSGHGLSTLIEVFFKRGSISYQEDVENSYLQAIVSRGLVGSVPYVQLVLLLFVLVFIFSFFGSNILNKRKIRLTALWILLAGLAYGFLMYYLYMTGFSEYEARELASFDRYMATYIVAAMLLTLGVVLYFTNSFRLIAVLGIVVLQNMIFFVNCEQLLPGNLSVNEALYIKEVEHLKNSIPENSSVAVVIRNEMALAGDAVEFYSYPIDVGIVYPGAVQDENNRYCQDYSDDELISLLSKYEYIYFMNIDDEFINRYSGIFETPSDLIRGEIYKVSYNGNKIVTE